MHNNVKLAVDNGDTLSLKYIFCDCLDGDPTFEKYQEDYDYCVRNNALFEAHRELHPMLTSHVDEEYWVQLKNDFMENPSKERLAHMREVAKILYRDRIARIQAERAEAQRAAEAQEQQSITPPPYQPSYTQPPQNTGNEGVRRVSERRTTPPPSNAYPQNQPTQNGTSPKKASGAGCVIPLLILAAIVVIVVLIIKNQ